MQGAVRNNGLHFTVGKNAYSYKIPKQEGDVLTYNNDSQSLFTVSDDGGYWKVTLNDNHDNNYNLWKGTFTIKTHLISTSPTLFIILVSSMR